MEIESGYPSESDAQANPMQKYGRPMEAYDPLNESKISFAPLLREKPAQDARFRIFHSLGFQGNPNDALDLICLTLRGLDFVSTPFLNGSFTHASVIGLASAEDERLQTEMPY